MHGLVVAERSHVVNEFLDLDRDPSSVVMSCQFVDSPYRVMSRICVIYVKY